MAVSANGSGTDFQASIGLQDSFSPAMAAATAEAEKAMGTFTKLSANVVVLNQALELMGKAWTMIQATVSASVGKYAEAERVTTKLQFALANQGEAVAEGVAHFQNLTKEIQKHSTTSASTLMTMAAQAKAMGHTTEMTDQLLKGSVELAAVMDTDVNAAFMQLLGTLTGNSRGIGRYVKEIKAMTPEALMAGEAIKYAAERMKGFAEVEAGTMLGKQAQITNAFGSIKKAIGEVAATTFHIPGLDQGTNPVAKVLLEIADAIKHMAPSVKEARDSILEFGAGLKKAFVDIDWPFVLRGFSVAMLEAAAAVGVFVAVANSGAILAALPLLSTWIGVVAIDAWAMVKAFTAASASVVLMGLKIGLAALGFVMLGLGIDLVIRNIDKLGKLFQTGLIYALGGVLIIIREVLAGISKVFPSAKAGVAQLDAAIERLAVGVEPIKEGLDFGVAGKTWDEAGKFMDNMTKGSDDMAKKLAKAEAEAGKFGGTAGKHFKGLVPLSDEFKKKLDEILKRYKDNQAAIAEAGLTEGEAILVRVANAQKEIDTLQAALQKRGMLSAAIKEQLALARAAEQGRGNTELEKIRVKFMDEAAKKADEMQQALEKQTLTERELVVAELQRNLAAINLIRLQAIANKVYGPEMAKNLNDAAAAANQLAETKLGDLPLTLHDAFKEVGAGLKHMKMGFLWTGMGEAAKAAGSYLGNAMLEAGHAVGQAVTWAIENGGAFLKKALSGDYMNMVSDLLEFVGNIPDMLVAAANRLGAIIDKLIAQFPAMVQKLVDTLPAITQKIADAIPKMVDSLVAAFPKIIDAMNKSFSKIMGAIVEALPKLAEAIGAAIPKIVGTIMDFLPKLIAKLPDIIEPLLNGLVEAVGVIIDKLPDVLVSIFQALPRIFLSIFKALPTLFENFLENIDKVVYAFIDGFLGAIGEIVGAFIDQFFVQGGAERIVGAILRAIPKIVVALVRGIITGLAKLLKGIFTGGLGGIKAPAALTDLPKKLENSFKKLGQIVQADSSKLFAVKDFEKVAKGGKGIADAIGGAIDTGTEDAVEAIKGWWQLFKDWLVEIWGKVVDAVRAVWQWVYDVTIAPLLNGLRNVWEWVQSNIVGPIVDGVMATWQWVLDTVVTPMLDGLNAVWLFVQTSIVSPLVDGLNAAWGWVKTNILDSMKSTVDTAWASIKAMLTGDMWKGAGNLMWLGFKGGLDGASAWLATQLGAAGKSVWYSLSSVWEWITTNLRSVGKNLFYSLSDVWDWLGKNLRSVGAQIYYALADVWDWLTENLSRLGGSLFTGGGGGGSGAWYDPSSYMAKGGTLKVKYLASGMRFPQAVGPDTAGPFMGEPGEFLVNARSASANAGLLAAINASGGNPVSLGNQGAAAAQTVVLNVTINARTTLDAEGIKRQVIPEIDKHLKRRSLDGAFVLATAGVQTR
jgi:hypothetical protein